MIGVVADPAEREVVREFFELFKTPWEFCREDKDYDVLLCAHDHPVPCDAKLVVIYCGNETCFDKSNGVRTSREPQRLRILRYQQYEIPVCGDTVTFPERSPSFLFDRDSKEPAAYINTSEDRVLARIGYDLFAEVRRLLTFGQSKEQAATPTLDLHIELLRRLIVSSGLRLVEIPPVPSGYSFIACLTHDVDHPSLRNHGWDHTALGFLHRATLGSLQRFARGRIGLEELFSNWLAALKLPLICLGLAKDVWREFDDRYLEVEKGLPSTFFIIPYKNYAGKAVDGWAPDFRAAAYGAEEIADTVLKLKESGHEVGLHGIDSWIDASSGRAELEEIRKITGRAEIGVRMHWLYFTPESPGRLEAAGASYDSTVGYNETIGFRAGTTQVYRSPGTDHLFELPLHIMDTALFYPTYLNLSREDARAHIARMMDIAARLGGCLTVNWHDRSLLPERHWGPSYRELLEDLNGRGVWFATAAEVVAWFRKRRAVSFGANASVNSGSQVEFGVNLPGLRLRTHETGKTEMNCRAVADVEFDVPVEKRPQYECYH